MTPLSDWVSCRPCAKLNLFLDVLGRRDDGFHELDSVMIAIDWCDELRLRRVDQPGVQLRVGWLPDRATVAGELKIRDRSNALLKIPSDETNLVHRALTTVQNRFGLRGGWEAELGKRIPSGAGMGGASSDAASAIGLSMEIVQSMPRADVQWPMVGGEPSDDEEQKSQVSAISHEIAASVGSDVPFFLGPHVAARVRGRGERLTPIHPCPPLHAVVVYPPESVSTAAVYASLGLRIGQTNPPLTRGGGAEMETAVATGDAAKIAAAMHNALQIPARGLSSRIAHALECLHRVGLTSALMTGSGSACFALAHSAGEASEKAEQIRRQVAWGAMVRAVSSCQVPAAIVGTKAVRGNHGGNN